jgi:hypothetical protein
LKTIEARSAVASRPLSGRQAHTDREKDVHRILGVLQGRSESHGSDDSGEAEGEGHAGLDDDDDAGHRDG